VVRLEPGDRIHAVKIGNLNVSIMIDPERLELEDVLVDRSVGRRSRFRRAKRDSQRRMVGDTEVEERASI